jgi:hypothetical protein
MTGSNQAVDGGFADPLANSGSRNAQGSGALRHVGKQLERRPTGELGKAAESSLS